MKLMKTAGYALAPLGLLVLISLTASVIGCGLIPVIGDGVPPAKVISKTALVFLVIGIYPLMLWLKISVQEMGFTHWKKLGGQIAQGIAIGLLTLSPVLLAEYFLGIHQVNPEKVFTLSYLAEKTAGLFAVAMLIAVVEEPLFRGLLLGFLKRKLPLAAAVTISAGYYASLHFLRAHSPSPDEPFSVIDGLYLVAEAYGNIFDPLNYSAWSALLMVGLFLALLRLRAPQNLGLCIGCHAAWVWQIKMSKTLFVTRFDSDYGFWVSQYDGIIGWLVAAWMAACLCLFGFSRKFRRRF